MIVMHEAICMTIFCVGCLLGAVLALRQEDKRRSQRYKPPET